MLALLMVIAALLVVSLVPLGVLTALCAALMQEDAEPQASPDDRLPGRPPEVSPTH